MAGEPIPIYWEKCVTAARWPVTPNQERGFGVAHSSGPAPVGLKKTCAQDPPWYYDANTVYIPHISTYTSILSQICTSFLRYLCAYPLVTCIPHVFRGFCLWGPSLYLVYKVYLSIDGICCTPYALFFPHWLIFLRIQLRLLASKSINQSCQRERLMLSDAQTTFQRVKLFARYNYCSVAVLTYR